MTRKFELKEISVEVPFAEKKTIEKGRAVHSENEPELIKSFETEDDALATLSKYETTVKTLYNHGMTYFLVEEFFVEINEYDEDGEWINGGDVVEISDMKNRYKTRDFEAGNEIEEFDTLEEAIEAIKRYEEQDKKEGTYEEGFYEVYDDATEDVVYHE
jgi:hypothetical protein